VVPRRPSSAPAGGRAQSQSARGSAPSDCTLFFLPKRQPAESVYGSDTRRGAEDDDRSSSWVYPRTKAQLHVASKQEQKSSPDRAPRPFLARTLYEERESCVGSGRDPAFFANLKKRDQTEAERKQAEEKKPSTRSSAAREMDGQLCHDSGLAAIGSRKGDRHMPTSTYKVNARRALLGSEPVSATQFVKFKGALTEMSTNQRDFGCRGQTPQQRMGSNVHELAINASTMDLAAGTAKTLRGLRLPGYQGHCPAHKSNVAKVTQSTHDHLIKKNSRNLILLNGTSRTMPGYSGFEPRSIMNDTGRPNCPPPHLASSSRSLSLAQAGQREKAMNRADFGKATCVRQFFSQGGGMADNTIADQYFVKFRPMEGVLKTGAPAERAIPPMR